MTRLSLALHDFALPADADSAPRLPALDRLLARGDVRPSGAASWRHWLLQRAGLHADGPLPLARVLAGDNGDWAVATPLHLIAGLEQVYLDPQGPPVLAEAEWQALCDGFNDCFGGNGLRLQRRSGLLLLSLPRPLDVVTRDPEPLAGSEAGAHLPAGPDGGWLRRLMTEIQMWLHDHPLNAGRAARGLAPLNALWIWGCEQQPLPQAGQRLPRLATRDPFLRQVWQRASSAVSDGADAWQALEPGTTLVSVSLAGLAADPADALQGLQERWLLPLQQALAEGRLRQAELLLGPVSVGLGRGDRFRFWRRPRAWHEALR